MVQKQHASVKKLYSRACSIHLVEEASIREVATRRRYTAMSRDRADSRHTGEKLGSELQCGIERVIQGAIRSWATTLRLCLILSVVAATLTIVAYVVDPSVLPLFTK